jgi:hypothetical protein
VTPRPPADAVIALRSLERRFRTTFAGRGDDEAPDDLAHRVGPLGRSALEHLAAATRDLTFLGRAVEQVLVDDEPALHPAVAAPADREWPDSPTGTVEEHLDQLAESANALADRVAHVGAAEWARQAAVAGSDARVTAASLLWDAVDSALEHRSAAERVLSEVRGRA